MCIDIDMFYIYIYVLYLYILVDIDICMDISVKKMVQSETPCSNSCDELPSGTLIKQGFSENRSRIDVFTRKTSISMGFPIVSYVLSS